jgi:hypothetical protein
MTEVSKGFGRGTAQWLWDLRQGIRPVEPAGERTRAADRSILPAFTNLRRGLSPLPSLCLDRRQQLFAGLIAWVFGR